MTLQQLFQDVKYSGTLPQAEAAAVTQDSRRVKPGSVFVCTVGRRSDGHEYAAKALEAGAVCVVTQRPLGLEREVQVEDGRKALALLSQNFFGRPAEKLKLIAVTGTNGKTTVTTVIKQVLEAAGRRCGLIGTIHTEIDGMELPAKYTTPEAWDLAALMARMAEAGCEYAVMEASSQALDQLRLYGLRFVCGAFTNLTQDHLDYHGTMEAYFMAKASLFDQCDAMVVNYDDEYGRRLAGMYPEKPKLTFSDRDDMADYTAHNIQYAADGVKFAMVAKGSIHRVAFPMPGEYSVSNAMCAAVTAVTAGVDAALAARALASSRGVRGRSEVLYSGDFTILCDYAHTGDGVEKILSSVRPFVKGRLIALFGCAGERDAKKRPQMAEAVIKHADIAVLTSDNPRGEDPEAIIRDVEPPLRACGMEYYTAVDRRRALELALGLLEKNDVLVLCGKGHEDYQVIDGVTLYLDEHRIVADWLREKHLR
ncbi:MAG: UDP-N-acetylmuramoyl-L-alanyl-D-glutamate--2,6-diaminopimelate ligase [Oscillospiraceae bacterium]|nr:UDP-N-acetylmuramoyl-L-alanyl-D-glutamate--2,6-diaminopimelate ligase [Oscillospiraceae bacterium]